MLGHRSPPVRRVPHGVQDPPQEPFARRRLRGKAQGDDPASGLNPRYLPQGHEQELFIPETHHLGGNGPLFARGENVAHIPDGRHRPGCLNHQADHLVDPPVAPDRLLFLNNPMNGSPGRVWIGDHGREGS